MERRNYFKLGDKVEIHDGEESGREGHIVRITSMPGGEDSIEVRLAADTLRTKQVTPAELRHANP